LDVEEETRDRDVRSARSIRVSTARLLEFSADVFGQPVRDHETQLCPAVGQSCEHRSGCPGEWAEATGDERKWIGAATDGKLVRAVDNCHGHSRERRQDGPHLGWHLAVKLDDGMRHHSLQVLVQQLMNIILKRTTLATGE
jgi:hypothetical protein